MTSAVKDNQEFALWIGRWSAKMQQQKDKVERVLPFTTASTGEKTPDPDGEGTKC